MEKEVKKMKFVEDTKEALLAENERLRMENAYLKKLNAVNKNEFKPNNTDPMGDLVLAASEIEMMSQEVKEFSNTMEW